MTQLAYLTDPLTLEFEANIVRKTDLDNGQVDIILDRTYFYPTGGGQEHDTGRLNGGRVVDVFKDEDGNVVHRVAGEVTGPVVTAQIDRERRLDHMQHHTGQHILSGALEQTVGLETLSSRISAESPSTIDVPDVELSEADLVRAERLANRIVFENRPVKSYFIAEAEIETVPFRRPPKVTGQVRVIEIDAFDYSACGGAHCPGSGMVGLIKIIRTERKNKKLRLHFVVGRQALLTFQHHHEIVTGLARQLNTGPEEVVDLAARQAHQLEAAQREIKDLRAELLAFEVRDLAAQAPPLGTVRVATKMYQNRSMNELRELGKLLQAQESLVALLAGYDGQKLSLVVSCGDRTGLAARELLAQHLARIGGKGGGDARLAQGGGTATTGQAERFFDQTIVDLGAMLPSLPSV